MAKTKTLCRVHWLLHHLSSNFKGIYTLKFDYSKHCYFFYRMKGRSILDCFTIVRTSKHCFRVSYFNSETLDFQAFTLPRSINVARRMCLIYRQNSNENLNYYSELYKKKSEENNETINKNEINRQKNKVGDRNKFS